MTEKQRKLLISLIILVIIIILIIAVILAKLIKKEEVGESINEVGEDFTETYGKENENEIDRQSYFDVNDCVKQYLSMINIKNDAYYGYDENGQYVLIIDENVIKQNIYNILSQKYIEEKNITINNLYQNVKTVEYSQLFVPLEISLVQDDKVKSFAVHGITENQDDFKKNEDVFFIVNIDVNTSSFSIEPIYEEYKNVKEIKIDKFETEIKQNNENKIAQTVSNYEQAVKEYINLYKRLALGAPEQMYNLLDKEYRETKFGNIEKFKNYINENRQKITGIKAEKYQVTNENEYTQFVCVDQDENYYIFREYAILNYSVILDTYTIELPEFTKKYAKATDEEKVLLNLQKCFEAINNKDYKYVYEKLDTTFKNNNFKNESDFESYIKDNLFEKNKIQPIKVEKQGEFYVYNLAIKDNSNVNSKTINKTFIMQLKDKYDFVTSFNK